MMKDLPDRQEWRVPIILKISAQPLYIKVILTQGFPALGPQIQIMSRVSHKSIEDGTYYYKGPALLNWNQNC